MDLWQLIVASIVAPSVGVALLRLWAKWLEIKPAERKSDAEVAKDLRDEIRADLEASRERIISLESETALLRAEAKRCEDDRDEIKAEHTRLQRKFLELEDLIRKRPPDAFLNDERSA